MKPHFLIILKSRYQDQMIDEPSGLSSNDEQEEQEREEDNSLFVNIVTSAQIQK